MVFLQLFFFFLIEETVPRAEQTELSDGTHTHTQVFVCQEAL